MSFLLPTACNSMFKVHCILRQIAYNILWLKNFSLFSISRSQNGLLHFTFTGETIYYFNFNASLFFYYSLFIRQIINWKRKDTMIEIMMMIGFLSCKPQFDVCGLKGAVWTFYMSIKVFFVLLRDLWLLMRKLRIRPSHFF